MDRIEIYTKGGKRIYRKEELAKKLGVSVQYIKHLVMNNKIESKGYKKIMLTNLESGYIEIIKRIN